MFGHTLNLLIHKQQMREVNLSTIIERLDALRTNPDWTDSAAIEYAKTWIAAFQQECGESWIEPVFVLPVPFGDDEVALTWIKEERKLSFYVCEQETMAFQIVGDNPDIEDSSPDTPEELAVVWKWLLGGPQ